MTHINPINDADLLKEGYDHCRDGDEGVNDALNRSGGVQGRGSTDCFLVEFRKPVGHSPLLKIQ